MVLGGSFIGVSLLLVLFINYNHPQPCHGFHLHRHKLLYVRRPQGGKLRHDEGRSGFLVPTMMASSPGQGFSAPRGKGPASTLKAQWPRLQSAEAKLEAARAALRQLDDDERQASMLGRKSKKKPPKSMQNPQEQVALIMSLLQKDGRVEAFCAVYRDDREPGGLGSGPDMKRLRKVMCANVDPNNPTNYCSNPGDIVCRRCGLVSYCCVDCQSNHWPIHRQDCLSDLRDESWLPSYWRTGQTPSFVSDDAPSGPQEYLWGNMPAMDLTRGLEWGPQDDAISLCFAASGDLRNVIASVNAIPDHFTGNISITINDLNPRVAVRNFALLYLLLEKGESAIDMVIGLWYSVAITHEQRRAFIQRFGGKLPELLEKDRQAWGLDHGPSNLLAEFPLAVWEELAQFLASTSIGDLQNVDAARKDKWLSPSGQDKRERHLHTLAPAHRVSWMEFRHFGLVYPMGGINAQLNVPNPLLLHPKLGWTLAPSCDPLEGWPFLRVMEAGRRHEVPPNDLYGSLYFYLQEELGRFVAQLSRHAISIEMYSTDASQLATTLAGRTFDRIDLSNIVDMAYGGVSRAVPCWAPLLKPQGGVMTAYFMNWHVESGLDESLQVRATVGMLAGLEAVPEEKRDAKKLVTALGSLSSPYYGNLDTSPEFRAFLEQTRVEAICEASGLTLSQRHRVVAPRLGVQEVGAPWDCVLDVGPEEEYGLRMQTGVSMLERFVEFYRKDDDD